MKKTFLTAVVSMLQTREEQLQIAKDVDTIFAQIEGQEQVLAAPLIRDFEEQVKKALIQNEQASAHGEEQKRQILDAVKYGKPLPYSSVDVCGVWLTMHFSDTIIFCDGLIGLADTLLSSLSVEDANREVLEECKRKLVAQRQSALDSFREVVIHWPWLNQTKVDKARDYFDAGGKGIPLEAMINGLRD